MPTYCFEHPDTGEIFEEFRLMADYNSPFFAPDGKECKRMMSGFTIIDKNEEVFQKDEDYTKLTNPKFIKFKDGHKEKYNPTKHVGGAGKSFDKSKLEEGVSLPKNGRVGQKIFKAGDWYAWDDDKKAWEKE